MPSRDVGIYFNQKMLTYVLGVVALGGAMVGGVTYLNNQSRDIADQSRDIAEIKEVYRSIEGQISKLGEDMNSRFSNVDATLSEMALAVRELEVRQETRQSAQIPFSYRNQ